MSKANKRKKIEFISWLLNFSQTNIDDLPEEEKRSVLLKITIFASAIHGTFDEMVTYERHVLSQNQRGFNSLDFAKRIQGSLKTFVGDIQSFKALALVGRKRKFLKPLPPFTADLDLHDSDTFRLSFAPSFSTIPDREQIWCDNAVVNLGFLLNGIRIESIKGCKECGRFFVNPSLKRKDYCNPKCTWKALSRSKREALKAHPRLYQAYLKKQSTLMHESYVKRVKGLKQDSKIKVARRPWKHGKKQAKKNDTH